MLEFLEGLAVEERAQSGLLRIAMANEPGDIVRGDAWTRGEDEQPLDGVA